jgi:superfamily I DNA/RNA helicase
MQLSQPQKQAVEYLGGPQIILAGAGSGKTRVIVAKAQYLIEEKGYSPESLLVITYSTKTQAELEERMAILGNRMPEMEIIGFIST